MDSSSVEFVVLCCDVSFDSLDVDFEWELPLYIICSAFALNCTSRSLCSAKAEDQKSTSTYWNHKTVYTHQIYTFV